MNEIADSAIMRSLALTVSGKVSAGENHIHGTHVPVEEPSTASIADVAYALETRFLRSHQKTAVLLYSQQHDKPTPPFGRKTDRFLASARCNSNNCRASIRARERSLGGAEVARADHRTYSLGSFVSCYCMDPKDSPEGFNRVAVGSARPR